MDGDIAGAGMQQSLALGFMRDFVGEHDDGIRVADLVHKIPFVTADAFEGCSPPTGSGDIVPPMRVTHIYGSLSCFHAQPPLAADPT